MKKYIVVALFLFLLAFVPFLFPLPRKKVEVVVDAGVYGRFSTQAEAQRLLSLLLSLGFEVRDGALCLANICDGEEARWSIYIDGEEVRDLTHELKGGEEVSIRLERR